MSTAPIRYIREDHKILDREENILMVYPSINAAKRASRQFQAVYGQLRKGDIKTIDGTQVVQVKEVRQ